jgi:hypothetical protein
MDATALPNTGPYLNKTNQPIRAHQRKINKYQQQEATARAL